jgi:hypothetical protein
MDVYRVFGLPARPLFVHLPVVGIPLCALGLLVYLLRPSARRSLALPLGAFVALNVAFTVLAAGSGEQLEEHLPTADQRSAVLHQHAELGDQLRLIMIVFGAAVLAYLVLDRWLRGTSAASEPTRLGIVDGRAGGLGALVLALGFLSLGLGAAATVWDVRTGHAGAEAAWADVGVTPDAGGGEASASATP